MNYKLYTINAIKCLNYIQEKTNEWTNDKAIKNCNMFLYAKKKEEFRSRHVPENLTKSKERVLSKH